MKILGGDVVILDVEKTRVAGRTMDLPGDRTALLEAGRKTVCDIDDRNIFSRPVTSCVRTRGDWPLPLS